MKEMKALIGMRKVEQRPMRREVPADYTVGPVDSEHSELPWDPWFTVN